MNPSKGAALSKLLTILISATINTNAASFDAVCTAIPRPTQFQVTHFQEYAIVKKSKKKTT
jgi:hypothetical protein